MKFFINDFCSETTSVRTLNVTMLMKKLFLVSFVTAQKMKFSQENACVGISFYIKLQVSSLQLY